MKPFIESGELVMLGLIQEQHPERCRLFFQWQSIEFPVAHDLPDTVGIEVVPVYVAIDEHGIVRALPRSPKSFADEFINKNFDTPTTPAPVIESETSTTAYWKQRAERSGSFEDLVGWADSLILWEPNLINVQLAIELYRKALDIELERSDVHFRLGAACRKLYELGNQTDAGLFGQSVSHWETALQQNPNQYIYRRRIEQYGPRLSKPYSFYDWIWAARSEITARGETPIDLNVEPAGAEFAGRARAMTVDPSGVNPDPKSEIKEVERGVVTSHTTFVPTEPGPGDVVAVHVGLNVIGNAKWNHESAPLVLWINAPTGGLMISNQLIRDETPHSGPETSDPVTLSFEIQIPENQTGDLRLTGFALFNICDPATGQCLFRRHDVMIDIPVSN